MFKVNLMDLDREGSMDFQRRIPTDHALWEGTDLTPKSQVSVALTITATPTGQVVARGSISATLARPCRRCLKAVDPAVEEGLELVWAVPDTLDARDDDGEIRTLDPRSGELDLGPALREELVLAAPTWVVCDESCRGLCPVCGVNRNVEECECSLEEPDPRWDALRALKND